MANSTLQNLKHSAFVRTPPTLAVRAGRFILSFPEASFNVFDPTSGEGDFFYACAHAAQAQYFGVEISSERAAVSRQRWPNATILTSAFEAVHVPPASMGLVITNPPYFFLDGKRAEYRIIVDAGEALMPGGIMLALIPARSAWDGTMINHWLKWYDDIRVWMTPARRSKDDESAFEDYTQIWVAGVRRATPTVPSAAEKKRLQGYHWREPEKPGQSGWKYGVAPTELPDTPIADPYHVPASRTLPRLVVRNADEATLLYALDKSGAHLAATWQQATTWPEEGYLGPPAMPYTGDAHIAAEVMIGGLDGEIVLGPGAGPDAQPHLFTAFVGQEWVAMPVDDELKEKLYHEGCVRVEMRQLQDKPILGVLNLQTGKSRYYQGETVFEFLKPWIPTLASRVIAKRQPLYRLDPADWEIRVTSQFGRDKRLPQAAFPGLAVAQMHRVFAMCRSLDVKGRAAIQGEPGTGKTRLAGASAARQAYRWRHRSVEFLQAAQPAWMQELRRAWLKNPSTLAMLGLEPVYGRRVKGARGGKGVVVQDSQVRQIVAYRVRATGELLAPEDAGPKALPVLITTPLKVTKEYGKEILAAFPQAEIVHIESQRDIQYWLARCANSDRPVIFGIFSHSTTRAFGREWREMVIPKLHTSREPVLNPSPDLLLLLEPVYEDRGYRQKVVGYRFKEGGKLLTKEVQITHFYCVDCGGRIDAVPGKVSQPDEEDDKKPQGKRTDGKTATPEKEGKGKDSTEPVTSRTWFTTKQRWCKCPKSQRNQDRLNRGKRPLRNALWTDDRTKATNRKHPQTSFAAWAGAMATLGEQARRAEADTSTRELVERVRRDEALLVRLVEAALMDPAARALLLAFTERVDAQVSSIDQLIREHMGKLTLLLQDAVRRDGGFLRSLVVGVQDDVALQRLGRLAASHLPDVQDAFANCTAHLQGSEAALVQGVAQAVRQETETLTQVMESLCEDDERYTSLIHCVCAAQPSMEPYLDNLALRKPKNRVLIRELVQAAQQHESVLTLLVQMGLKHSAWSKVLLEQAQEQDAALAALVEEQQAQRQGMADLVVDAGLRDPGAWRAITEETFLPETALFQQLVHLAVWDVKSLTRFVEQVAACEDEVRALSTLVREEEMRLAARLAQAARRDSSHSILVRLLEGARHLIDWSGYFFRSAFDRAHQLALAPRTKKGAYLGTLLDGQARPSSRGVRLFETAGGPITVEMSDLGAAGGYEPLEDDAGNLFAYQLGHQGRRLFPLYGRWSRRIVGYVDEAGNKVTKKVSFGFCMPPPDSFSPYEYLYTFYRGCVALSVIDESHNGRGRSTDIAHSHHLAMRAAQTRELTSGTHYGGDILGFYHYWFRFNPVFWQRLGFGWNDAEQALTHYGVIQEWTKEYESDARKGSGQTDVSVSTVPAPGLSANLIPGLLEDLGYLTVLDVGAHMPPKREIPRSIPMVDPQLEQRIKQAEVALIEAQKAVAELEQERASLPALLPEGEREALLVSLEGRKSETAEAHKLAQQQLVDVRHWADQRDLAQAYAQVVSELEDLARGGNTAARLALGTVPRWFAALPCESPFQVYQSRRGDWGDKEAAELVIQTPVLPWDHLYPLERWLIDTVRSELAEHRQTGEPVGENSADGRHVMVYFEQNAVRSMAKRLQWVLKDFHPWTLPNGVEAEDRQQAILDAVQAGHRVVIVPYRRVNEGLNLQSAIDTIIWAELAMNLFYYIQASQRAWRLGKENEVRIYIPYYIGSAAHKQTRRLGERDGAASAFAGEPAKGGLVKHVGADQTTLARLSAQIEQGESAMDLFLQQPDDSAEIEANFARRNDELQAALKRGRQWFGVEDHLPKRLAALAGLPQVDVWASMPQVRALGEMAAAAFDAQPFPEEPALSPAPALTAVEQPLQAEHAEVVPAPGSANAAPTLAERPEEAGQRSALILVAFGDEEAIKRARQRRGVRPPRSRPRPKNPTTLKTIPAWVEPATQAGPVETIVLHSIWDVQEADEEPAVLSPTPLSLWA